MSGPRTTDFNAAVQRFDRFKARPEIQRITTRYADWATQGDGCMINLQLAGLATLRLAGRISRVEYRASVRKLANASGLPQADFKLLAECSLELARFILAKSQRAAAAPSE